MASLESGVTESEIVKEEMATLRKAPISLENIVTDRYVVCLECGKKMRTLKSHLKKVHNLRPEEYVKRYKLDPKKYPLVCKEYSEQRRKLAKEKGIGAFRRNSAKSA